MEDEEARPSSNEKPDSKPERPKPAYDPDIASEIQKEGKGDKDKQNP